MVHIADAFAEEAALAEARMAETFDFADDMVPGQVVGDPSEENNQNVVGSHQDGASDSYQDAVADSHQNAVAGSRREVGLVPGRMKGIMA